MIANTNQIRNTKPAGTLPVTGFWRSAARFTREIQEHVPFQLNIDQMQIRPATAEVTHSNIVIGQIQKAHFGVRFEPYKENIAAVELKLLMDLQNVPKKVSGNFWNKRW